MPEYLGVDIGSEWLTTAVVGRTKAGPVVRAFNRYQYPQPGADIAARAAFAARTVAESTNLRLPIAVSISGAEVFLRPLVVPFTKASLIAKTLKFEVEGHLPFDVETAVLDYAVVETAGKSSRLLVAAIGRQTLQGVVNAFAAAGLAVRMITADVLAAPVLGMFLVGRRYGIMDVSASAWKLGVCDEGRLVFARAAAAAPAADRMEASLGGWFKQSLMAAAGTGIDKLYLVGEISGAIDCRALEDAIGVPVVRADFPDSALDGGLLGDKEEVTKTGAWAVAVATSLSLGKGDFDLYGAAYGRHGPVDKVFVPAVILLCLFTALFAAIGWGYGRQLAAVRANIAELEKAQLQLWKQILGDEAPPAGGVHSGLLAKIRDLEEKAPAKALGGKAGPILQALYAAARAARPGTGIEFLKFEAKPDKVIIEATAPNDATAQQLANDIAAAGVFDAAVRELVNQENRVSFKVDMKPRGQ